MNDKQKQLVSHLSQNFGFDVSSIHWQLDNDSEFFKYIQTKLAKRIEFFINTDMDRLLHILYRIDIKERDSDQAFHLGKVDLVAMKLAELIIRRQLQKIDYSRKFHSSKESDS